MADETSIVVISGANSGVGYRTVKHLYNSEKSYKIYLGARSLEKAQKAIDSLKSETGYSGPNEIVPLVLDVDSDESIAATTKVLQAEGRVDVLINNAGKRHMRVRSVLADEKVSISIMLETKSRLPERPSSTRSIPT